MEYEKDFSLVASYNFSEEFQINKFGELPDFVPDFFLRISGATGVFLSVQGKGWLPENDDCVTFRLGYYNYKILTLDRHVWICTAIVNILDVEGNMKFPRTFEFQFLIEPNTRSFYHSPKYELELSDKYVEHRYVERGFILNNASEYLRNDTLTVIVEGCITIKQQKNIGRIGWTPRNNMDNFEVEDDGEGLRIFLRKDSVHAKFLIENSSVFRDMWGVPMQESQENRVLLENREVPAFLCMLFFIETKQLILCIVTVFDVYKIAHKYHVEILLHECRKRIKNILLRTVTSVLDFATCYVDTDLRRNAESYLMRHSLEAERVDPMFEIECNSHSYSDCHTDPIDLACIKSKMGFEIYMTLMWNVIKDSSEINENGDDGPPLQILNRETEP